MGQDRGSGARKPPIELKFDQSYIVIDILRHIIWSILSTSTPWPMILTLEYIAVF